MNFRTKLDQDRIYSLMDLDVSSSDNENKHDSISEEQFQQYVDQRRDYGAQARREVASDRYPLKHFE